MRILILLVLLFSLFHHSLSQERPDHKLLHKYQGDYFFNDSTYITGGPMDEVENSLVFLEPMDGSFGAVFKPISETEYESAFTEGVRISFDIENKKVKGLWWEQGGTKRYALRKSNFSIHYVTFKNKKDNIELAGELAIPDGKGPFPIIINIHGSGPQPRHLGPWGTFFLRYGIAILSYDKRGVNQSTGYFPTAGYIEYANDVLSAIEFVKKHPKIDNSKIGIHGSSEGGWVSSIVAASTDDLSFMIVRVGPGVSGAETVIHEIKNELPEELTLKERVEAIRFERKFYNMAIDKKPLDSVNALLVKGRKKYSWFPALYGDTKKISPDYWEKVQKTAPLDPVKYLRQVGEIPVLWFLAENDENVPYSLSLPRIRVALKEAGNQDFEIVTIPNAKHSFLVLKEGGGFKYTDGYWDKMLAWLRERGIAK